jgi:hypothetical protein
MSRYALVARGGSQTPAVRRNLERSIDAITHRSAIHRDVIIRPSGKLYWPQPSEERLDGEVLLDSFEIGFWSVASLEDALERRSAK